MDRLQHLFHLAQKTGDTLIIHDQRGNDMVIMDVHRYEDLIDEGMYIHDYEPLHEMDERDMLDKINRDIAVWRSHREEEDRQARSYALEETLKDEPLFDPFEEDVVHHHDWFTAGDVLHNRHEHVLKSRSSYVEEGIPFGPTDEYDMPYDDATIDVADIPDFDEECGDHGSDISYDEIGERQFARHHATKDIPFMPYNDVDLEEVREDDDDELIFFEEPV